MSCHPRALAEWLPWCDSLRPPAPTAEEARNGGWADAEEVTGEAAAAAEAPAPTLPLPGPALWLPGPQPANINTAALGRGLSEETHLRKHMLGNAWEYNIIWISSPSSGASMVAALMRRLPTLMLWVVGYLSFRHILGNTWEYNNKQIFDLRWAVKELHCIPLLAWGKCWVVLHELL